MKLIGYIEPYKELMFTIPIYTNNGEYFYHEVDEYYKVCGFNRFYESDSSEKFITITNDFDFVIGNFGAIVFKGIRDYLIIDQFEKGVKEVKNYLKITTKDNEFLNIKEDVTFFESLIPKKIEYSSQKTISKDVDINNDTKYILDFLDPSKKIVKDNYFIIITLYEKVSHSSNIEKAIIEFKRDIDKIKPAIIKLTPSRSTRRTKPARKRVNPRRRVDPEITSVIDLSSKAAYLKTIIEKMEKTHIKKFT